MLSEDLDKQITDAKSKVTLIRLHLYQYIHTIIEMSHISLLSFVGNVSDDCSCYIRNYSVGSI